MMAHVLSNSTDGKAKAEETLHAELTKASAAFARYKKDLVADESERRLLDTLVVSWDAFVKGWDELRPIFRCGVEGRRSGTRKRAICDRPCRGPVPARIEGAARPARITKTRWPTRRVQRRVVVQQRARVVVLCGFRWRL